MCLLLHTTMAISCVCCFTLQWPYHVSAASHYNGHIILHINPVTVMMWVNFHQFVLPDSQQQGTRDLNTFNQQQGTRDLNTFSQQQGTRDLNTFSQHNT